MKLFFAFLNVSLMLAGSCAHASGRLMTFSEYRTTHHSTPYVIEVPASQGRLLYYGSAHLFDPDDPQIKDIEARWATFHPTFALNEGGTPPALPTREDTVARYGEAALVRWLAQRDKVPVDTFEPSRRDLVERQASRFTYEQIKLATLLRTAAQDAARLPAFRAPSVDREVERVIGVISRTPGLEGPPNSILELEASVARLLPQLHDWRQVPLSWFDPAIDPPIAWTNRLAAHGSNIRDEFIMTAIVAKVREGHRVFAVVGSSHVVMQEQPLRRRIRGLD
jgi:hypothetical protein